MEEHPKPQVELLENTYSVINDYSKIKQVTFLEAALVLFFNELRCIHTHFDWDEARKQKEEQEKAGENGEARDRKTVSS